VSLLSDVVKTCVRYKAAVVEEDELDAGRRSVLNLGHTTAHALEVSLGFGRIRHGEAVALGLLVALAISERLLGLNPGVRRRTAALLADLGLRTSLELPSPDTIGCGSPRQEGDGGFRGSGLSSGRTGWGLDVPDDHDEALR
jgi:3-dehydroquinate synthetase